MSASLEHRIHIFGASGAGTSTLGCRLAAAIGGRHLDADDYYWFATDPPFTTKRDPDARVALIEQDTAGVPRWILSGSICSWGDRLLGHFTLAVFLHLDSETRMARLLHREQLRYGARIQRGGDMHAQHLEFMDWARSYDEALAPIRSLDLHERWMQRLACPVVRLDSRRPTGELLQEVLEYVQT
jgi:adenylate kinase family enzyme